MEPRPLSPAHTLVWGILLACLPVTAFAERDAADYEVTIVNDFSFPMYAEYDYGLDSEDIAVTTRYPVAGRTTLVAAHVHNLGVCMATSGWGWYDPDGRSCWGEWDFEWGTSGTIDITYRCHDDVTIDWRVELDGVHLVSPSVPGCGSEDHWKLVTVHDVPISPGMHTIFLGTYQMDFRPDFRVDWVEIGDVRIEAESYDRMGGNDPNPDLRGLLIRPMAANPPENVNLLVQIWDGDPASGGTLISEDFVGQTNKVIDRWHVFPGYTHTAYYLENGATGRLLREWTPIEPGTHDLYVIIDPEDVLGETDELNNIAVRSIMVYEAPPDEEALPLVAESISEAESAPIDLSVTPRSRFGGQTSIAFSLPEVCPVHLAVFDVTGRRVTTLAEGEMNSGQHTVFWNGRSQSGAMVEAGVFFVRLAAGSATETRRLVVIG